MDDIPEELITDHNFESQTDALPKTMFFTETQSPENGLYYVCRRGVDVVAYFGASKVMYLSQGEVFTLEFPGSKPVIPVTNTRIKWPPLFNRNYCHHYKDHTD